MFDTISNWVMERVWALHGMNCKEAIRLASRSMDAPLSLRDRLQLRFHFLLCSYCHHYYLQRLYIRKWLRGNSGGSSDLEKTHPHRPCEDLPRDARTRILHALSQHDGKKAAPIDDSGPKN
ncbi:MAG TPA: hypothetical protein VK970_09275 [Candidatus Methylacidiphilales bacterium]|nr:hypothetical protein [Candidatus Methylacidiphilales bacterium]